MSIDDTIGWFAAAVHCVFVGSIPVGQARYRLSCSMNDKISVTQLGWVLAAEQLPRIC